MTVFVGVDGGATKTRVLACRQDGVPLLDVTLAGCSYTVLGFAGLASALTAIRATTLTALPGAAEVVWALGLPGHGDGPQRTRELERAVTSVFGSDRYRLHNDVELAHVGALGGRPGVVVASGTGSIAFGIGPDGRRARAGGWGPTFGDEGSAYAIGVAALRHLARASDGRAAPDHLADELLAALHAASLHQAADRLGAGSGGQRAAVAALARVVDRAAEAGDAVANRILAAAGTELAELARAPVRVLGMEAHAQIAFAGGTFASRGVREAFTGALRGAGITRVQAAAAGAAEGGVLLARGSAG